MIRFPRLLPWMLALALASLAARAPAEPFTIEHMLRSESLGAVRLSPDGRHVLFERMGPYDGADRFDLGFLGAWSTSEVWIADRDTHGPARPLLDEAEGRGVVLGDLSPSGRRLTTIAPAPVWLASRGVPLSIRRAASSAENSPFTAWVRTPPATAVEKTTSKPDCSESCFSECSATSAGTSYIRRAAAGALAATACGAVSCAPPTNTSAANAP